MIKLAHVVTSYTSVVTILDSKLRALNHYHDLQLAVIASLPENESRKPSAPYTSIYMSREIEPLKDIKSFWQLYKLFKKEQFDIVHSHTAKAGFLTAFAAKLAGIRCICHTSHGLPFFEGQSRFKYFLFRGLEKAACRCRHYLFTQNKKDMDACVKLMGSRDKVLYEGNGVDVEWIKSQASQQVVDAEKDYPESKNGLRLLFLCRLEPVKRPFDFLEIMKRLKDAGCPVTGVIAGNGILMAALKERIDTDQLAGAINLVGFTNRPHGLIAAADIVLLCSEKEGIPRALMEAMALSKPVIATDVLGTQELVENNQTGYLVPLGDIDAFVEKIKLLLKRRDLQQLLGSAGNKRVNDFFNDIKIAERLHDFYLKVSKQ